MKVSLIEIAQWAVRYLQVFGAVCLAYAAYEYIMDWFDHRVDYVKKLEAHNRLAVDHNQKLQDLVDWSRSRELELTEERNRLRNRNALLSQILKEDDICSERKKTQVMKK